MSFNKKHYNSYAIDINSPLFHEFYSLACTNFYQIAPLCGVHSGHNSKKAFNAN